MTEALAPRTRAHAPPLAEIAKVATLALVAACALSLRPIVASELRYALSTREMIRGGDWVVPHLCGVPYLEKPILFYWLSAGAQRLLGTSPLVARVPSILGTVMMLVVAYALAYELRGRRFARATAGVLAASLGFLAMGTSLTTDALFAGCTGVAWYALWRHLARPGGGWRWAFWIALAASTLAKGPLGPAMIFVSGVAFAAATRRVRPFLRLAFLRGGLLFAALAAPWHVALWMRDPRLLEFWIVRQNLRAAADGQVNHSAPFWYYVPVLLVLLFPFSVLVVTAYGRAARGLVRAARASEATPARLRAFLAAVAIAPLLLLTVSGSKLGTYVLPLLPFLGVLVAREAVRAAAVRGVLLRVATAVPAVVVVAGVAVGVPRLLRRYDLDAFRPAYVPVLSVAVLALVCGLLWGAWLGFRRRRGAFVAMGAGVLAALVAVAPVAVDPGARFDAREMAARVAEVRAPDDLVVVAGGDVQDYSIRLVLETDAAILGRARELGMGHFVAHTTPDREIPRQPTRVDRSDLPGDDGLLDAAALRAVWAGPRRVWLFGDEDDLAALRKSPPLDAHRIFTDGKNTVWSNVPAADSGDAGTASPGLR